MRSRTLRVVLSMLVGLLVAAGIAWWQVEQAGLVDRPGTEASVPIGGPFSLTDHTGRRITEADFRGKLMLVYFGYTYCPDICPTELYTMSLALDRLGAESEQIRALFVSVDPERDDLALLRDYIALFHPDMVAATGTPDEIEAMARAYRVYYARAENPDGGPYLMDHSTFIYLMSEVGDLVTVFPAGGQPEAIVDAVRARLTT